MEKTQKLKSHSPTLNCFITRNCQSESRKDLKFQWVNVGKHMEDHKLKKLSVFLLLEFPRRLCDWILWSGCAWNCDLRNGFDLYYQKTASIQRHHGDWYVKERVFRFWYSLQRQRDREIGRVQMRERTESLELWEALLAFLLLSVSLSTWNLWNHRDRSRNGKWSSSKMWLLLLCWGNCMQLIWLQLTKVPLHFYFFTLILLGVQWHTRLCGTKGRWDLL